IWKGRLVSVSSTVCGGRGSRTCWFRGSGAAVVDHHPKLPLGDRLPLDLWRWHNCWHDADHDEHCLRLHSGGQGPSEVLPQTSIRFRFVESWLRSVRGLPDLLCERTFHHPCAVDSAVSHQSSS